MKSVEDYNYKLGLTAATAATSYSALCSLYDRSLKPLSAGGLLVCLILSVLNSAQKRKRLDGNTFKLLNVGLLGASIVTTKQVFHRFGFLGKRNAAIYTLLVLETFAVACPALQSVFKYGLPKLRLWPFWAGGVHGLLYMTGFLGAAWSCYASMPVLVGSRLYECERLAFIPLALPELLPAVLLALNGAARAGSKRLSSRLFAVPFLSFLLLSFFRSFSLSFFLSFPPSFPYLNLSLDTVPIYS